MQALSKILENAEDGIISELPELTEINVSSSTGSIDSDGDGLTDYGEMIEGTNPDNWDTDGDGLSDLIESLDANQDPLVVELDAPEIQALAPKVVGEAWLGYYTTYEILFEVKEENLDISRFILTMVAMSLRKLQLKKILKTILQISMGHYFQFSIH